MKALGIQDKRGYPPMISQQVYYSLAARELEDELVPLSLDEGVGMLIWSPLAFGLLSGKYRRDRPKPENTRLAYWGTPGEVDYEKIYNIVDVVEAIAKERNKTIPQVALNWLLQRPSVTSVIIGARNEAQLKENLGAIGWNLSREEMERLDKASTRPKPYPYWHQLLWSEDRNVDVANRPRVSR
jgi:aryl-alcohol dehydrogenase-like predicted oxidoreductase